MSNNISTTSTTTTTTNSNGNFSGGLPTTSATNPGYVGRSSPSTYDPGQPNNPSFTGRNSNPNYGGAPTYSPSTPKPNVSTPSSTPNSTVNGEPTMTVDEVYGKTPSTTTKTTSGYDTSKDATSNILSSNQPSTEKQGDYVASSNEKSKVETSTFGKQDEVSVTPELVTENKGEVGNDTIQSVEGLDFQQKDKQSQEVLDSKKARDEVEAEEKAGNMRDRLRNLNKTENETDTEAGLGIGDRDEDVAAAQAEIDRLANEKTKYENEYKKNADVLKGFDKKATEKQQAIEQENADYQVKTENNKSLDVIGRNIQSIEKLLDTIPAGVDGGTMIKSAQISLDNLTSKLGINAVDLPTNDIREALETFQTWEGNFRQEYFDGLEDFSPNSINEYKAGIDEDHLRNLQQFIDELDSLAGGAKLIEDRQKKLQGWIADNEKKSIEAQKTYDDLVNETFVGEETTAATEEAVSETTTTETTSLEETKKVILESNAPEEVKTEADEILNNVKESKDEVLAAAATLPKDIDKATPEQIEAFVKANEKYLNNVKKANNKGIKFANTDFNTDYTKEIAKANDFNITFSDGSTMSYADFSAEMATKSPQIASAMYNAKAKRYEDEGKDFLAKIERTKAKMAGDTVGSKFTFADDMIRNQFIKMAETNERATYAAYNNVINDKSGKYSADDIAEAKASMKQSEMLSTAAATLKDSTGLLSGSGDSVSDGVYGTTDPNKLETYQKIISTIENVTKIILGAGVTPGAADAWNNLYYTAGDEVRNSKLFNTVFNFDPDGDGFSLFQEYGNNATVGLVMGLTELGTGVAMAFNPATAGFSANLIGDSVKTLLDNLYGVQGDAKKAAEYTKQVLDYFKEAKDIASKSGNEGLLEEIEEAINTITTTTSYVPTYETNKGDNTVTVNENFELKQDEVGSLDNWLEGSGSNTADNEKFNQALTYDEWLKLIEADPTMREYAKNLLKDKLSSESSEKAEEKADAEKTDAE